MAQNPGSKEPANFLGACLVESDSEFLTRARRIKRRALVASIVLQVLIVAALVLFPLLSKGESIAGYTYTPVPPYRQGVSAEHRQHDTPPHGGKRNACRFCAPRSIPPTIVTRDANPAREPGDISDPIPGSPESPNMPGLVGNSDHRQPPPPSVEPTKPRTIHVSGGVQAARLVRRIEPIYPPLAKQLRRQGRVELRAIISTQGTIQSLEVISGDPLLIQSALAAVNEWRYQPTLLNGEPVVIDTYITVIYTLSH
jgi:periplasmic protein TonB